MKIALAIPVARLPQMIEDSEKYAIRRCLKYALSNAENPQKITLLLLGNGVHTKDLQAHCEDYFKGWTNILIRERPENEGVPVAMHNLWGMAQLFDQDVICYLHDDCFLYSQGWDEQVRSVFTDDPNCDLAGVSGATGFGVEGLYDRPYLITHLMRLGFVSNIINGGFGGSAEVHGRRGLERERIVVTDGCSMFLRRSLLDHIEGWSWWPFVHHNYDTAIACQVARARKHAWYLPIVSDHLSGYTANNVEGQELLKSHGGETNVHLKSARYLYDMFKDVLPLRI